MNQRAKHIGIFISFSGQGGVERMICNLAQGLLNEGFKVDMVIARARGGHLRSIPTGVRQIRLGTSHTSSALPALAAYLRKERPSVLLAAKDRAIKTAVLARFLARPRTVLVGRIGTTVSAALEARHPLRKVSWTLTTRIFYRFTDRIIAVSEGVMEDVIRTAALPREKVVAVPNPVITPGLLAMAAEPVDLPWFHDPQVPVIAGVGRLTRQKDFPTLIRAVSEVRKFRPCRLIILGEGGQRRELESLVSDLGMDGEILLPGFVTNPYRWLSRSSLFVLSSRWEGSPNALTEAMALGIPVVSTDCRSGPREILRGGEYGSLVRVGDHRELAGAIRLTLENPPPPDVLRFAVNRFTVTESVKGYLEAFGWTG